MNFRRQSPASFTPFQSVRAIAEARWTKCVFPLQPRALDSMADRVTFITMADWRGGGAACDRMPITSKRATNDLVTMVALLSPTEVDTEVSICAVTNHDEL